MMNKCLLRYCFSIVACTSFALLAMDYNEDEQKGLFAQQGISIIGSSYTKEEKNKILHEILLKEQAAKLIAVKLESFKNELDDKLYC